MIGVTVEEAINIMLETTPIIKEIETVALLKSGGRILAVDMAAPIDQPPFNRAPVDGYACKAEDTMGASKEEPVKLKVVAEIHAGDYKEMVLQKGEAVRIMTGAAIPEGCDCCIRQESTNYGEEEVEFYEALKPFDNYCYQGEDFKKGTVLLTKGIKLGYVEIGILASMGYSEIPVYKKPKVALLTTGDEVTTPGQRLLPGKIYNSNLSLLVARMMELGIEVGHIITPPDDARAVAGAIAQVAPDVDVILTTGGVSVGKKDILHEALPLLGAKRLYWRVKLQPGTPVIYSIYKDKPVISLSGNPFGAITTFELLVRPVLAKMGQEESLLTFKGEGIMRDAFPKVSKNRRYIRAIYKEGKVSLPKGLHASGILSSMIGCNCLVEIPAGTKGLEIGDQVVVVRL